MNKSILSTLLLLLLVFSSCEDENEQEIYTNPLGSQKEIVGNMKVSTFKLPNELLAIDRLLEIKHQLFSLSNGEIYEYRGKIKEYHSPEVLCEIHIPIEEQFPDGDYCLTLSSADDSLIFPTQFKLTFEDEMVSAVLQESANYSVFKGEGTKDNPYLVDDLEKLFYILYSDPTHAKGVFFIQSRKELEVPMQGESTDGRGHIGQIFAGNYDGNNFVIKDLTYNGANSETKDSDIGFFSKLLDGACISNVEFSGVKMHNAANNVGVIASHTSGTVKLKNITISGSVQGANNVGGLIGSASGSLSMEDITLKLSVKGEKERIGGLLGKGESGLNLTIKTIENSPAFSVEGESFVGGLVGDIKGSFAIEDVNLIYTVEQEDSDVAILKSTNNYLGGIIGKAKLTGNSSIKESTIQLPIHGVENVAAFIGDLNTDDNNNGISLENNTVLQSRINGSGNVAGFVGSWQNVKTDLLKNLTQEASITGTGKSIGGFVGYMNGANWQKENVSSIEISPVSDITGEEQSAGGVFGYVKNIKNDIDISPTTFSLNKLLSVNGADCVGGIAGRAENCSFTGNVSFTTDEEQTITNLKGASSFPGKINNAIPYNTTALSSGGLIGYAHNCTIKGVMADGAVRGAERIGGIIGHSVGSTLSLCVKKGESVESQKNDAGGICGKVEDEVPNIKLLLNFAEVTGKGGNSAGGIIGYANIKKGSISDLINVGKVTGVKSTGGIIGYLASAERGYDNDDIVYLERCVNFGEISGSYDGGEELYGLGGIVGSTRYCVQIKECANHGEVTALSGSTYNGVGGVVGVLGGNDGNLSSAGNNNAKIISCCNTATITTKGKSNESRYTLGGVTGRLFSGYGSGVRNVDMHNCYNKGAVNGKNERDNGGLLGSIENNAYIHECINIGKVEHGNGGVGSHPNSASYYNINYVYILKGSGKDWKASEFSDSQKQKESTFKNFSFGKYWYIDNENKNDGFPYLVNCYYQFASCPTE